MNKTNIPEKDGQQGKSPSSLVRQARCNPRLDLVNGVHGDTHRMVSELVHLHGVQRTARGLHFYLLRYEAKGTELTLLFSLENA